MLDRNLIDRIIFYQYSRISPTTIFRDTIKQAYYTVNIYDKQSDLAQLIDSVVVIDSINMTYN